MSHPEPCPTPRSPFPIGAEVVVISGRHTGLPGRVIGLNECGTEWETGGGARHIAICEALVELDRHSGRPMWFRYDQELAAAESAVEAQREAQRELPFGERTSAPEGARESSQAILKGARE